jgi:hypothetical protein
MGHGIGNSVINLVESISKSHFFALLDEERTGNEIRP